MRQCCDNWGPLFLCWKHKHDSLWNKNRDNTSCVRVQSVQWLVVDDDDDENDGEDDDDDDD